jgi:predicted ester cyclase
MRVEEQNKVIFEKIHQAIERDGFTAQADFFAERTINHGIPATREINRAVLHDISDIFPDVRMEPINIVAEGEWVVGRYTFSGTHKGMGHHPFVHSGLLAGVPPTGKRVSCTAPSYVSL